MPKKARKKTAKKAAKKAVKKKTASRPAKKKTSGKKSEPAPQRPRLESLTEQIQKQEVARAIQKRMMGEELTARERSSLKRHEQDQEELKRWEYYESIPQKHWREMSGRQAKTLRQQEDLYGIPFGRSKISLPQVVLALHDFLAANYRRLNTDDDELMQGEVTPALELYRQEKAKLARLERLEREGSLIPEEEIHELLLQMIAILRTTGDQLQRQFGPEAAEVYNEGLREAERHVVDRFESESPKITWYSDLLGDADADSNQK